MTLARFPATYQTDERTRQLLVVAPQHSVAAAWLLSCMHGSYAAMLHARALAMRGRGGEAAAMKQLPEQLAPFSQKIADSLLAHVDITPVIGRTTLWQSKLRGVPYYPKDRSWPCDVHGKPLVMLVQINFSEMPRLEGYPSEGILQIYISAGYEPETQMWGMRSDGVHQTEQARLTDQSFFRVIYFPTLSLDTSHLIAEAPDVVIDDEYPFPAKDEARLEFTLGSGCVRTEDYRFRRVFGKDRAEFFRFDTHDLEEAYEDFVGSRRYIARIGGYSRVEQMDPRLEFPEEDWILLFSLDSEGGSDYPVGWGSGGIGSFYIRTDDLVRRDFSRVMYYWDFS